MVSGVPRMTALATNVGIGPALALPEVAAIGQVLRRSPHGGCKLTREPARSKQRQNDLKRARFRPRMRLGGQEKPEGNAVLQAVLRRSAAPLSHQPADRPRQSASGEAFILGDGHRPHGRFQRDEFVHGCMRSPLNVPPVTVTFDTPEIKRMEYFSESLGIALRVASLDSLSVMSILRLRWFSAWII